MRTLILLALLFIHSEPAFAQLTAEQFQSKQVQDLKSWIGKPFPQFSFPASSGKLYTNADFSGKTTLVDIWELGCVPCMFSIKYFNAVQDSLAHRGFQLFSILKNDLKTFNVLFSDKEHYMRNYTAPSYEIISMGSAKPTTSNLKAIDQLNQFGWPLFLVVDGLGIIRDVYSGFAVGDDVHAERQAIMPFENHSIKWMISVLGNVQSSQR